MCLFLGIQIGYNGWGSTTAESTHEAPFSDTYVARSPPYDIPSIHCHQLMHAGFLFASCVSGIDALRFNPLTLLLTDSTDPRAADVTAPATQPQ